MAEGPRLVNGVLHYDVAARKPVGGAPNARGTKYTDTTLDMTTEQAAQLYKEHKGERSFRVQRGDTTYLFDGKAFEQKYWEMQRFERYAKADSQAVEREVQTVTTDLPNTTGGGSTLRRETQFTTDEARRALFRAGEGVNPNKPIPVMTTSGKTSYVKASEVQHVVDVADDKLAKARYEQELKDEKRKQEEYYAAQDKEKAEMAAIDAEEEKLRAEYEAEQKSKPKPAAKKPAARKPAASTKTPAGKDFQRTAPKKKPSEYVADHVASTRKRDRGGAETSPVSDSGGSSEGGEYKLGEKQFAALLVVAQALSGKGFTGNAPTMQARNDVLRMIAPLIHDYVAEHRAQNGGGQRLAQTDTRARVTRAFETSPN